MKMGGPGNIQPDAIAITGNQGTWPNMMGPDMMSPRRSGQRTIAPCPAGQMQQSLRIRIMIAVPRHKMGIQAAGICQPHANMKPAPRGQPTGRINQIRPVIGACQDKRLIIRHPASTANTLCRQMRKPGMNNDTLHDSRNVPVN